MPWWTPSKLAIATLTVRATTEMRQRRGSVLWRCAPPPHALSPLAGGTQVGAGLRRAIAEGLVTREQLWARSTPRASTASRAAKRVPSE